MNVPPTWSVRVPPRRYDAALTESWASTPHRSRSKARLRGALRTSPLFVAVHVPLQFVAGWSWPSVVVGVMVLAVMAPFFRYLLGETLVATGGSLLTVGILHAAQRLSTVLGYPGEWPFLPAMVVLAVTVGLLR